LNQKNSETDEAHVLKLITEPQSRKIMESIQENPKSVIQISKEIGVLQSMIYRRLHKFEKYNLLKTTVKITNEGKKSFYYQSKINGVNVSYEKGNFQVNLIFN